MTTTPRQPTFKILRGELEGEYTLRIPFTQGELEVIWEIANVGIMEFDDEIARGNPKLLRALFTLALTQAGRVVEPGMLADLRHDEDTEIDWPKQEPETAADGSPLVASSSSDEPPAAGENGSPTGESSEASSDTSPASATELFSGSPGSELISELHRVRSAE